jgi:hypothetical protein
VGGIRRIRRLALARRIVGNGADRLQALLHRRCEVLVDAEIGGHAIDLVHEFLTRFVVIDLLSAGDGLVTVEPVERRETRRDRGNIAGGNALSRELDRWSQRSNCSFACSAPLSTARCWSS